MSSSLETLSSTHSVVFVAKIQCIVMVIDSCLNSMRVLQYLLNKQVRETLTTLGSAVFNLQALSAVTLSLLPSEITSPYNNQYSPLELITLYLIIYARALVGAVCIYSSVYLECGFCVQDILPQ